MESLIATRSELLDRRRRAVFVAQGRDLLKDKRTALVREFRHHRTELLDGLEQLRNLAVQARQRLDQATAVCGPEALASGALAAATGIGADLQSRTVAGVQVFDLRHDPVRRNPATRGWAPSLVSAHFDRVALAYEEQLEWLLDLCAVELSVRRLATEIARTTKQVNALDNIVLPQLRDEARRITLTLDEREREEHARLRRARTRGAALAAAGDGPNPTWSAA
ncbi:V-type ATP synthase subunit D [Kribbella sp. NPDC049174]|uniref:V-type ATP synthase subunit D n=1 Tax=Kribbella sp. NPDC049174 TaxID=3364112 RepID=UPI00370FB3F8